MLFFLIVLQELFVKHPYKAVPVMQHEVPHFGLQVAKSGDNFFNYLFVKLLLHPIVCGFVKQSLPGIVALKIVDDVEVVVNHVAARSDVFVFDSVTVLIGVRVVEVGLLRKFFRVDCCY